MYTLSQEFSNIFHHARKDGQGLAPMKHIKLIRNSAVAGLAASICLAFLPSAIQAQGNSADNTQRYMLTVQKGKGKKSLDVVTKNKGKKAKKLKYRDVIAADLSDKDLAKLLRHPLFRGAKVELDPQRFMLAEQVPYGISMIDANASIGGLTPGGLDRKVCIIDSGYDLDHPDLPKADRVTGMSQTGDSWSDPGDSHGTHVAGTVAALVGNNAGVVGVHSGQGLSLHIVKVFNDQGSWTNSSNLIDALDECVAKGANIVSMSLGGGGPSSNESGAFASALANGVLSIAAAGNSGNSTLSYPASYDSVVSVAAIDSSKSVASFSQFNSQVELSAPGVNVNSTVVGGGYSSYNGTSMATPHVAGAAALLWSNHAGCDAGQIRQAMAVSAEDLGAAGPDDNYGYGLVRLLAASQLIVDNSCQNLPPLPTTPPPPMIANGQTLSGLSGSAGDEVFYSISLPSGATNLVVEIAGGSGDADLYVRAGALPTTGAYDCRPWLNGNNESCPFAAPSGPDYYVMIRAYSAYSSVSLSVNYDEDDTGPPVNQAPVARITAAPGSGKSPLTVSFSGSNSTDDAGIVGYDWDLDGDSINDDAGPEVSRTYENLTDTAVMYSASLTVTDGELTDTDSVEITVAPANRSPVAVFSFSPGRGIDTETSVSFDAGGSTDPDGDSLSYQWNFGDGDQAAGQSVSHTFASASLYNVTLTVSDGDGGDASFAATVEVVAAPEPPPAVISADVSLNNKGNRADVSWSGAEGSRVRIYRDGNQVTRTRNDGFWRDRNYRQGFSYKVCEDAGTPCSPEVQP